MLAIGRRIAQNGMLLGSTLALLTGCDRPDLPPPPPPTVEVATPVTRDVVEYFYYTGTMESVETAEIRARVPGYLTSVEFDESSDVEAGDLLFTIERDEYEIAKGQAEAALERSKADRELASARVARARQAFEQNAASELEVIEEQAALLQAEADVLSNQEAVRQAELNLSYTEVRTPITGRIDLNYVDAGNLVGQSEPTLLATVVQNDPINVTFDVSERIVLQYLDRGDDGTVDRDPPPVEVGLADEEDYPHVGVVDFVDSVVDEGTATLTVRGLLENPTKKLLPGLFARIRVPWETREDAVLIREEAAGTGLEGKYVLLIGPDNVVERRPVVLGERQADGTVVVLEGLAPDETYIVNGLLRARPGAPVNPVPFEAPPAEPVAETPAPAANGG
ncbi:MAG: efflux RND transporter periplasmic adaptor subunit [Planctomycetota bacterium]